MRKFLRYKDDIINLDKVISITKCIYDTEEYGRKMDYEIEFNVDNDFGVCWYFDTEEEMNKIFAYLCKNLECEIDLKDMLNF